MRIFFLLTFLLICVSYLDAQECSDPSDPELCPQEWALQHVPLIRFDGSAQDYCYPDEATNENNGQCKPLNPDAPIYYKIVRCGEFLKIAWHLWYGHQKGCDPFGVDHGHDDDWEHININFIHVGDQWVQDSVTFNQHSGHYTRANTQPHPDVWIGKIAHGSYDITCDGHGFVWEADYCAGGCGYWDDFRNDNENSRWMPHNIKHVSEVTDDQVNRVNNYKYFDDPKKNKCEGFDYRCIGAEGPCGCWRNDHTFPADTICDV